MERPSKSNIGMCSQCCVGGVPHPLACARKKKQGAENGDVVHFTIVYGAHAHTKQCFANVQLWVARGRPRSV